MTDPEIVRMLNASGSGKCLACDAPAGMRCAACLERQASGAARAGKAAVARLDERPGFLEDVGALLDGGAAPSSPSTGETPLPCPFCSGAASIQTIEHVDGDPNSGGQFVECDDCGACSAVRFACGDDPVPLLIEAWNRRAPR